MPRQGGLLKGNNMTDIVDRLRAYNGALQPFSLCEDAADEIEQLRAAIHVAFMAMCAQRDNPDEEVFQDAIDALGLSVTDIRNEMPATPNK